MENAIYYHANINLGIAVALEWGLIVPVVRQAEQRSFVELARTINDLALRARNKKLNPDDVGGSTFTLTNSGIFGDEFSTPIINQPESAILCISGLNKEPAVLTDADGNDTLRFGRCSTLRWASITALSTAQTPASSCWNLSTPWKAGIRRSARLPSLKPTAAR